MTQRTQKKWYNKLIKILKKKKNLNESASINKTVKYLLGSEHLYTCDPHFFRTPHLTYFLW